MFQFRRFPAYTYFIQCTLIRVCRIGFPHSEISGSTLMCSSPKLIAACHVLHRLLMPRHSPCALYSLTFVAVRFISFAPLQAAGLTHSATAPPKFKPASLGFEFEDFWFSLRIMQAPLRIVTFWLNCIFTLKNNCFLTVAFS